MKRHWDWLAQALRDLRHEEVSLRAEDHEWGEAPLPVDVIPVKKEDLHRIPLARKALEKGIVLAERKEI